jgi:hypothetical protein
MHCPRRRDGRIALEIEYLLSDREADTASASASCSSSSFEAHLRPPGRLLMTMI